MTIHKTSATIMCLCAALNACANTDASASGSATTALPPSTAASSDVPPTSGTPKTSIARGLLVGEWMAVEGAKEATFERFDKVKHQPPKQASRGGTPQPIRLAADGTGAFRVMSPSDDHGYVAIAWTLVGNEVRLVATENKRGANKGDFVVLTVLSLTKDALVLKASPGPYLKKPTSP